MLENTPVLRIHMLIYSGVNLRGMGFDTGIMEKNNEIKPEWDLAWAA